ncbi:MAG TPA: hypothetical protein VK116_13900, partial [Planctomycetota bacterium]|nr:hypothetical protein [Planctomycetota bacterium]
LGKHADIAIWSGHPLSCTSRCEEVWIDGRRYFSLEEDLEKREEAQRMRAELVQKVLRSGEAMLPRSERRPDPVARFKSGDGDGCLHGVEDLE